MNRKTIITTVHGTFARKATWITKESLISQYLIDNLPGEICVNPFTWSGANTHAARLRAAEDLKSAIKNIASEHEKRGEEIDQFIVAHSHGGNVAMLACKDTEVENSVVGVTCLATPFLYFRGSSVASSLSMFGIILLLIPVLVLLVAAWQSITEIPPTNPIFGVTATIVIGFFIWVFIASTSKQISLEFLDRISLPNIHPEKIQIIRTVGDEANGVLAGAAMVNWLTVFFYSIIFGTFEKISNKLKSSIIGIVFIALVIAALAVVGHFKDEVPIFTAISDHINLGSAYLGLYGIIIPVAILVIVRFFLSLIIGFDIPLWYSHFMVTAEPVPTTGSYQVTMLRPRSEKARHVSEVTFGVESEESTRETLKHSEAYEHPVALEAIVKWMSERKKI